MQPWRIWVVAGEELSQLKALVKAKMVDGQFADGPTEYPIYPLTMKEPYISRKFDNGTAMYAALGISREDVAERKRQTARNFEFFGAPVGLFFVIDRSMQNGQWADLGMFLQSVMLLAREHGLHTAALESWALRYKTVGDFLAIPDDLMIWCGMGLGHMDNAAPVNRVRAARATLDEFAIVRGF